MFDIGDSQSKSSTLLLEQLRTFSIETGKNSVTRRSVQTCLLKQGRNLYNTLVKK